MQRYRLLFSIAFLFFVCFSGFAFTSDQKISLKAFIPKKMKVQLSSQRLTFDPIRSGENAYLVIPEAITVALTYNGFKPIRVGIEPGKTEPESKFFYLIFSSPSIRGKKIRCKLYDRRQNLYFEGKGEIFSLGNAFTDPLVHYKIPFDLLINRRDLLDSPCGDYTCCINLIVIEED